jgi:two-component system, sensor histidine kinase and response regulator
MESAPAKGAMIWFELSSRPSAQVTQLSASSDASTRSKKRVLVVEDNLLNQELVIGYLEESDYAVTLTGNGRQGLETFVQERFDVVLMDWQMPEMDGLEATRRIREFEQRRGLERTPIIAVTAHAMASDRDACIAAGMDDYLVKPYSYDALMRALRRWTSPA